MLLLTEMVKENWIGKFEILKNSLKLGVYLLRICYFRKNKKCTTPIHPPPHPLPKKDTKRQAMAKLLAKVF